MLHVQRPLRALLLAAVLAATTVSATYIRSDLVFARADNTCGGDKDLSRCSQTGLPDSFCCSKDTTCIPLAGDTTVLCCPEGSTCDNINPIVCNLELQDASKHPGAAIKTTFLKGDLATCGGGCCPYGYTCQDESCVMDKDQSKKPDEKPAVPSSSSKSPSDPTSTKTPETSVVAKPTATSAKGTEDPSSEAHPPKGSFPTTAVVGGVVGTIAGIVGITALVMFVRYRRGQAAKKRHDSSSSFGNIISNPRPISGMDNTRQDFLAKATSSGSTTPTTNTQARDFFGSQPPQHQQQPYSRFSSEMTEHSPRQSSWWPTPRSHHASAEVGGLGLRNLTANRWSGGGVPQTPRRDRRQPSTGSESINIFADPSDVGSPGYRGTAYTTWTTIMADSEVPGLPPTPTRRRHEQQSPAARD